LVRERFYYKRAKSHVTVIPGASHSVYESHPEEVSAVINTAAHQAQANLAKMLADACWSGPW
jgi:pimeloyl-ACP methyl ester carboxylesterase